MSGTTHIIGGGLAGLSAAVHLLEAGRKVVLYEAARMAGGRCRSYFDAQLGMPIDNGNHLLLSGNDAALDFLTRIGAQDALVGPDECVFDFFDYRDGARWRLRPNDSALPWWVMSPARRVPGSSPSDYLQALGLLRASGAQTIAEVMRCSGPLYERLWRPVLLAALNMEPPQASARLAGEVLRKSLARGGRASRPLVARRGLDHAFVAPALQFLEQRGGEARMQARLRQLDFSNGQASGLRFGDRSVELGPKDFVIVATPPSSASEIVPGLVAPDRFCAIVNAHYKLAAPPGRPLLTGLIGAMSEWVFVFDDRVSVTISGADHLMDTPREELAERIWSEVASTLRLDPSMPQWQIVKERRATFAATPEQDARRPAAATRWRNVFLAGDWTATRLPATIEGAIASGRVAAQAISAAS